MDIIHKQPKLTHRYNTIIPHINQSVFGIQGKGLN